jgi:hypothetical protein
MEADTSNAYQVLDHALEYLRDVRTNPQHYDVRLESIIFADSVRVLQDAQRRVNPDNLVAMLPA